MLSFKIRPNEEKVNICWTLTFPCCPELLNGRALDQHALASLWLEMLAGFLSWPLVRGSLLCSLSGRPRSKWEGLEWFEENNLNINLLTQLKYGCESWLIWWWTGRPGVLQFMGSQRVGHDWATELNWYSNWRRQRQPTPVLLPGKSHGQRGLVGYSPKGHKESDMTKHTYTHMSYSLKAFIMMKKING